MAFHKAWGGLSQALQARMCFLGGRDLSFGAIACRFGGVLAGAVCSSRHSSVNHHACCRPWHCREVVPMVQYRQGCLQGQGCPLTGFAGVGVGVCCFESDPRVQVGQRCGLTGLLCRAVCTWVRCQRCAGVSWLVWRLIIVSTGRGGCGTPWVKVRGLLLLLLLLLLIAVLCV
jgi:hypothetical protein